jgi:hypothetical protein
MNSFFSEKIKYRVTKGPHSSFFKLWNGLNYEVSLNFEMVKYHEI